MTKKIHLLKPQAMTNCFGSESGRSQQYQAFTFRVRSES
jgi:hypothetical protein